MGRVVKLKKLFDFFVTDIYNSRKRADETFKKEVRRR
jgi:hypothetical protein